MIQHFRQQYRLSLIAGFGRRKAVTRAVRTFFYGF
jgi:hypothetical protein